MRKFIIATIVAGGAVLGLSTGAQAAPAVSAIANHLDSAAFSTSMTPVLAPAVLGASPETLLEPVQYGPRGDWRRREEARRRAEWRRRQAYRRGYRR